MSQKKPLKRPEAKFIRGSVWVMLPLPHRDKNGNLIGKRWTKTDLIPLLRQCGTTPYDPFREVLSPPETDPGAPKHEYYFDSDYASELLIPWITENCIYPEGKETGKPFIPERWQWAIYLNMYCWKRGKGKGSFEERLEDPRRYTEVLIYLPRKNGKTTAFGAVPSLFALFVNREKRSQNFCCAADSEQASLNFRHAAYMVENNPKMLNRLLQGRVRHSIKLMEHSDGALLKVLSSIAETKHGLSPCYVGVDEVHAHADGELIDVMVTGTASRDEPQIVYTTTADFDRVSVCNEIYARARAIAEGRMTDPSFFPVIYEAPVDAPWDSEETWRIANPNYGISVTREYMHKEAAKAKSSPAILGRFKRLHLNIRTAVETTWIFPHVWAASGPVILPEQLIPVPEIMDWMLKHRWWFSVAQEQDFLLNNQYAAAISLFQEWYSWLIPTMERLKEEVCFSGYDNSNNRDIASLNFWFPDHKITIPWFWVPAESIHRRSVEDDVPYSLWYQAGIVQNTPLTVISEPDILTALLGPPEDFEQGLLHWFTGHRTFAYDRYAANFIASSVSSNGIKLKRYPQNFTGLNEPCKKTVEYLEQKALNHGNNPVLKWMIGHCQAEEHPSGLIRPSRKNSSDKIDGIVSMLMAQGAWIYNETDMITEISTLKQE